MQAQAFKKCFINYFVIIIFKKNNVLQRFEYWCKL